MPIYYHEVRGDQHLLRTRDGALVFQGEEHQLVTRTFQIPGDRYMSYRVQSVMSVSEFLAYLRSLKESSRLGPPVVIPTQRRSGEGRSRGRSVD